MHDIAEIEGVARGVAAQLLVPADWADGVEAYCHTLRRIAEDRFADPVGAIASRIEAILRDIVATDPLTIARRYYDLLPRQQAHPLTRAVIAALTDAAEVMRMLRACGAEVEVRKDDAGTSFLAIQDLSHTADMGDAFKTALISAMTIAATAGPPPQGRLHSIH